VTTIILFPVASLPGSANAVILGIVFFKAAEAEPQVEFAQNMDTPGRITNKSACMMT
jgi:hypothetical protein